MGLLPRHVEQVLERARGTHGQRPPASLPEEIAAAQAALASFWRPAARAANGTPVIHVFVGPPGSGKTTALCKWLAKAVLAEGRSARAWRLDSRAANFAGLLDVYGEILGVPVQREWQDLPPGTDFDLGFVDLPGVDPQDSGLMGQLRARLGALPPPGAASDAGGAGPVTQVHLVLNAAYDVMVTLAQARAFSALPVNDLIFTHLDEEKRRGKLWNFVLGTNFTVRFLSGGQNIPGEFLAASPAALLGRQTRGAG